VAPVSESPHRGDRPDPRAVRVAVGRATHLEGDPVVVVAPSPDGPLVDGKASAARLLTFDGGHATLADEGGETIRVVLGAIEHRPLGGMDVREAVVEGWRVVVELESELHASLRERARRGRTEGVTGGPLDVRAIIPGRIVALNVAPGDAVTAGQQLLVLEAMKMRNELRAPRDGTIDRVAIAVGETVDVGDLLLVIQ
jgi:biotin carboxyl carrier protein